MAELFGTFVRVKEDVYVVSEAGLANLAWNVEASDGKLTLVQSEKDELSYTLIDNNGDDQYDIRVEKQVHHKVNKTWKIDGQKLEDGSTVKLNGSHKGDFDIWSNQTFNSKGNRAWKRLFTTKNEAEAKKALKKYIAEAKKNIKSAKAE